jgi:hypothetical protein
VAVAEDAFLAIAEELYGLPPGEFTPARNDYAKQLKADGDKELSERVKALRKPAAAAWVVNMLVRHRADEMNQVLDLGESLRQAQSDLDGDALRELTRQRRRLISAVAGQGRTLARELGQKVSEQVQRQVEDTLHAAMIDPDAASAVRTGLLLDPLEATGVGSLKVATAVADHTAVGAPSRASRSPSARPLEEVAGPAGKRKTNLRAVPEADPEERKREERARLRAEAAAAVEAKSEELAEAQKTLAGADEKVQDLQARCLQVNGEIDELKRRIDELEDQLEHLDDEAEDAGADRDEAAAAVQSAEAMLAEAREELDRLSEE